MLIEIVYKSLYWSVQRRCCIFRVPENDDQAYDNNNNNNNLFTYRNIHV